MSTDGHLGGMARFLDQIITPLRVLRAPIIAAVVAFIGLYVPDQTIEIYRALAFDRIDMQSQIILAFASLVIASLVIWYIARNSTLRWQAQATQSRSIAGALLRWLPRILGALPLLGAGLGQLKAARGIYSVRNDTADDVSDIVTIEQWLKGQMTQVSQQFEEASLQFKSAQDFLNWSGYVLFALALALIVMAYFRSRNKFHKYENPNRFLFGRTLPIFALFLVISLVVAYCAFYFVSPLGASELAIQIGAPAILNIFIIFLAFSLGFLAFVHQQTKFPAISVLVVIAIISTTFDLNDNHAVRTLKPNDEQQINVSFALTAWLKGRPDRAYYQNLKFPYLDNLGLSEHRKEAQALERRAYPIYVVAAQGGGLYAAHQTALALARAQDRCPAFAQHVFAISGVSGGSLGAALFAALVEFHTRETEPVTDPSCLDAPKEPLKQGWYERRVNEFMKNDFLSPIVAAGLFPDFIQRFLPFPVPQFDRARAFEIALERAWKKAVPEDEENSFAQSFYRLWKVEGKKENLRNRNAVPALVLNTVEVQSGSRRLISPMAFDDKTLNNLDTLRPIIKHDIAISTAVGMSARFPWILPAATVKSVALERTKLMDKKAAVDKPVGKKVRHFRFVDGGIYEYSGAATALEIAEFIDAHLGWVHRQFRKHGKYWDANARVQLLVISDDEILEDASEPLSDEERNKQLAIEGSVRQLTQTGGIRVRDDNAKNVQQGFGELLSPVRSLLASRIDRAAVWVTRAFAKFCTNCYKDRIYRKRFPGFDGSAALYRLNHTNYHLTLGWQLSGTARRIISAHSGYAESCRAVITRTRNGWPWAALVFNQNNCAACRIQHDLNTSWLSVTGYLRTNIKSDSDLTSALPCRDKNLLSDYLPVLQPVQPASDPASDPAPEPAPVAPVP